MNQSIVLYSAHLAEMWAQIEDAFDGVAAKKHQVVGTPTKTTAPPPSSTWRERDTKHANALGEHDLVSLKSWPNLTRASNESVINCMPVLVRICALLSRQPIAVHWVHKKLGLPTEVAKQALNLLMSSGHLVVTRAPVALRQSANSASGSMQGAGLRTTERRQVQRRGEFSFSGFLTRCVDTLFPPKDKGR